MRGWLWLCMIGLLSMRTLTAAEPIKIWITDSAPSDLVRGVAPLFESGDYVWTTDLTEADLALDFERQAGPVAAEWLYVPVVSFASTAETIRWEDIRRYWGGELTALNALSTNDTVPVFVISNETLRAMISLLGPPSPDVPLRFVATTDDIPAGLWAARPAAFGIMSFNTLTPQVKVLVMDRISPFDSDFDSASYPLNTHIVLKGETAALGAAMEDLLALGTWQEANYDGDKMARVVLSGVTALARATAYKMEQKGLTTPADGIMPFLAGADIIHTSNEVSFTDNCGPPDPYSGSVIFCSQVRYFELLRHIGLNVVELTGNHNNDYGPGASRSTLDIYAEEGIGTFGGGYTPEDARAAYITEVNGNRIAFIGCNVPGPTGAWSTEVRSGAARCDDEFLAEELPRLDEDVDLIIMGIQEFEYYRYTVGIEQLTRFENYAAWGADVVIGSQAHQPQGFTFSDTGAFFHHGLGNLFFDQMAEIGTRQMFIDKLIVYDGRLINVVLFTGLIEDYCCPRPMTEFERAEFLNTIFLASGW